MPETTKGDAAEIAVPADLGPSGAKDVHGALLAALQGVQGRDGPIVITLDGDPGACSPLALQLLASATQSFPEDAITIGAPAAAALATLSRNEGS